MTDPCEPPTLWVLLNPDDEIIGASASKSPDAAVNDAYVGDRLDHDMFEKLSDHIIQHIEKNGDAFPVVMMTHGYCISNCTVRMLAHA